MVTVPITTEATTQAWNPRWGLLIAATVGVFVFLLRMPITGHIAGTAIEARRIAASTARLPELLNSLGSHPFFPEVARYTALAPDRFARFWQD